MDNRKFSVSSEELKMECLRRKYLELLTQPEVFPSEENWDFIISNHLQGLGARLYRKFVVSYMLEDDQRCDYHNLAIKRFPKYIQSIERDEALDVVYSDTESAPDGFVKLVYDCQLFDCERIGHLVDNGQPDLAADLLGAYQPEYDGDTIDAMQFLLTKFDHLPSLGTIEVHKGVFKTERRYICPDGHSNPHDVMFCEEEGCGKDIYGLTEAQRKAVEQFSERIGVLRDMLD